MGTNVESRLSEMLPAQLGELSILERKVSTYLLKHEDKLMGMDISEIAKASGVSKATVVRFCKALGFNGLKDFKIYYEAGKSQYATKVSKLSKGTEPKEVMEIMKGGIIRTLEKSLNEENLETLLSIADDIATLKYVTVLCTDCDVSSMILANRIKSLGYKCDIHSAQDAIANDIAEGLIFVLSPTCELDGIGSYVRKARDKGCKIATFTSNPKSWLAVNSNNMIAASSDKLISEDRYILSNFAINSLIEILYALLVSRK